MYAKRSQCHVLKDIHLCRGCRGDHTNICFAGFNWALQKILHSQDEWARSFEAFWVVGPGALTLHIWTEGVALDHPFMEGLPWAQPEICCALLHFPPSSLARFAVLPNVLSHRLCSRKDTKRVTRRWWDLWSWRCHLPFGLSSPRSLFSLHRRAVGSPGGCQSCRLARSGPRPHYWRRTSSSPPQPFF